MTAYCNNLCGAQYFYVGADTPLPAGTHQGRIEVTYDGNGFGKGGQVGPYLDGKWIQIDTDEAAVDSDHTISGASAQADPKGMTARRRRTVSFRRNAL